ncbi:MAG: hypothetical protein WCC22_10930 [Terriglobales bacterium]
MAMFLVAGTAYGSDGTVGTETAGMETLLPWLSRTPAYLAIVPVAPVPVHAFWDRTNRQLFTGIALMRVLDYTSTLNMQRRGREEILLPDDVVNNRAGFAALEAASTATSIGLSYLLHRTGHHKLERWLSIGHISATGFGAARNYALESHHRR